MATLRWVGSSTLAWEDDVGEGAHIGMAWSDLLCSLLPTVNVVWHLPQFCLYFKAGANITFSLYFPDDHPKGHAA